ncbi:MAG: hypothetical protein PQJ48_02205 [Sphaerochaetaceae bacterium]|nr:hypothetical protein [Sphaerochaetaceae bacterium]
MKKALIPILLVLLLTLAFTSCDANIRQDIAGLMGDFSENVYIANGFVEANTANAAAVTETTASIGTGDSAEEITGGASDAFGIDVTGIPENTKIIKPQTEAEQEETKDDLATAFASPTQTAELVESLKAPITDPEQKAAAEGTVILFNATLEKLKDDLATNNKELSDTLSELALPEIEEGETLTQGDVLVLQMMTNLISNTVATLNETTSTAGDFTTVDGDALTSDKVLSIVDDALFTAQVAEQLSGAASIDFSGQLDLAALLSGMNDDSSQSVSRAEDDNEFGDVMVSFNNLIPDLLPVMGITVSGNDFAYTQSKYKSFLMNQKAYRGSIEHALRFARMSGLEDLSEIPNANFDTSTLIKYMLSVLITEHHAYWASKGITSPRPEAIIAELLDDNPEIGLGTMPEGYEPVEPTITGFSYGGFEQFLHDGTTEKPRSYAYYEAIVKNLQALNSINGITQLKELLDDLLDDTNADNLQSMYDDWDN